MGKKVAISQSNYIPWKGYFDLINMVDEFVLYDDLQYTRRDWRNRNKIKTPTGLQWLTIPVEVKGKYYQKIKDTMVSDPKWNENHWRTIKYNYAGARHFRDFSGLFEELYLGSTTKYLSEINHCFLTAICGILGIKTKTTWSMEYNLIEGKTERLVNLCKQANATEYFSGPAARDYIVEELFQAEGIALKFMDYSGYSEYDQLYPPFEHAVSVMDLIFNMGTESPRYMKSFE